MAGADAPGDTARAWISPGLFVFAAAGVSLGLSDVWRFPQLLAGHASPWFPVLYLAVVLLVGVPLLVAELALARMGHGNPSENFGFRVDGTDASPLWRYAGTVVLLVVFMILCYTAVVAGWMMSYTVRSLVGGLEDVSPGVARLMFQSLVTDPERLLGWHTLFTAGLGWVAARGAGDGTGRFARRLVITVFAVAALLACLSLYHYGPATVLALDWPGHWSTVSGAMVMDAVTQGFYTLGICMGAILILGHYLPSDARPGRLVAGVVGLDILFVCLASLGVLPLVLSRENPGAGISFAVETLPLALSDVPLGGLYLGAFYALLLLLVATTAVVLMELLVTWVAARTGRTRSSAAFLASGAVWAGGLLALLSFSVLAFEFEFAGEEKAFGLFDVMDILSSQILLPVIGLMMAVFVGWNIDRNAFTGAMGRGRAMHGLHVLKRYLVPVAVGVIFVILVFGRVLPRV